MEFARGDREGFLGLTEVVRVMSVDNFFDYWTRLNHFVPAALIALNGTILDCAPHELTGLMTMVLLAGSVPVVFWMARAVLGYRGRVSLAIAALYGISPITWYAVAHVAMGQLLAAQAIAVLTFLLLFTLAQALRQPGSTLKPFLYAQAIAERRIAMLIDASVSRLPPFLTADAGLNSGFMIAHVTAAALASENKSLAHPASVDSLPTSANQEDHVSMATFAARRLQQMLRNTEYIYVASDSPAALDSQRALRPRPPA